MRKILVLYSLLLIVSATAFSQIGFKSNSTSYMYLAMGGFFSERNARIYPSIGGGFSSKNKRAAIGANVYYHGDYKFSILGDIRAVFNDISESNFFISVQPGILLYSQSVQSPYGKIETDGGFAFNGVIGFMTKSNGYIPGIYVTLGYGMYTLTTKYPYGSSQIRTNGGIFSFGINLSRTSSKGQDE